MAKKENRCNPPNLLTLIRIIIAIIIVFMIFLGAELSSVAIVFFIGMFTDFLDGWIARKFKQETKFGAKFDMVADRFLMLCTVVSIISYHLLQNLLSESQLIQITVILSREIIAVPVFLYGFFSKKIAIPKVRRIGKVTTFLQAFAFPAILLNFRASLVLSAVTAVVGIISGIAYARDVKQLMRKN